MQQGMSDVKHVQAKFLHQHQGDVVKCFFRSLGSSTDAKKIQADWLASGRLPYITTVKHSDFNSTIRVLTDITGRPNSTEFWRVDITGPWKLAKGGRNDKCDTKNWTKAAQSKCEWNIVELTCRRRSKIWVYLSPAQPGSGHNILSLPCLRAPMWQRRVS